MNSKNLVILTGSVGKEVETRFVKETSQVSTFTLATSESYKNKAGEKVTNTEWHNIEAWDNLSKIVSSWVKKGDLIQVMGSLKNENYTDKEGVKRYKYKIVAEKVEILKNATPKTGEVVGATGAAAKQTEEYATANSVNSATFSSDSGADDLPF